jgi:hypothetical protein
MALNHEGALYRRSLTVSTGKGADIQLSGF